jgi:hypothetical protein
MGRQRLGIVLSAACLALVACTSSGGGTPSSVAASSIPPSSIPPSSIPPSSIPAAGSTPAGSSRPATGATSIAGEWKGTYVSGLRSSITGDFTVTFTQRDSTVGGTIEVHPGCVESGTISGTISGPTITFGQVSGSSRSVTFAGTVTGDQMKGTYQSPAACGNDHGTWQASRS